MASKLYLCNRAPAYTPATKRGAWNVSTSSTIGVLDGSKINGGILSSIGVAETSADANYDVLLARFVSGQLGDQTIEGTLDMMCGVYESNAAADICYHIHIYVTTGDTDTPRGTLLTDYVETTANEWGITSTTSGLALASAQALTSTEVSSGDRIVIEVGYVALNSSATSYTGTLQYGVLKTATIFDIADDLAAAGNGVTNAGFITFSQDLIFNNLPYVEEQTIEVTYAPPNEAYVIEQTIEVVASLPNEAYVIEQTIEVVASLPNEAYVIEQWMDIVSHILPNRHRSSSGPPLYVA